MPAKKPTITPIPVQLSEAEFSEFIVPHLSMPKRGPKCKLGYHHVFNLILRVLYTGMPWKCLPVPKTPDGTDAIHDTTVYTVFDRWSDDGSLEQAFIANWLLGSQTPKGRESHRHRQAIHGLRDRVERTFAWEDKFKRLLLRFEHLQRRHDAMKLMPTRSSI